jgi:GNAT superfamily N-acetyltransferase
MHAITDKRATIDRLKNLPFAPYNVIGAMENTENKCYIDESTDSVWVENHYFNYLSGDSEVLLDRVKHLEDGFYGFSGVLGDLASSIYEKYFLHWFEPTERYVLKGDLPSDITCPYKVVKVPIEEAQGIDDRYEYKQDGSLDRIKDAILNRPSSAIYIEGQIASYVLVHEDNSIGYMFTLEKYRKLGLGYWVSLDIINQIKALGVVPFLEINKANFKSQGLAGKLGFEKDVFTPWFGIIKGIPDFFETWDPLEGASYIFSSIAQLRVSNKLTTAIENIQFEKVGETFIGVIDIGVKKATFHAALDDSREAYILKIDHLMEMTLYELVCAIAVHFPEHNVSIILPYDSILSEKIGGIIIKK